MRLEDSGGDGVVFIFDRLMRLRAGVTSSSGVPGGRIVSDDLPAHDLLVLIHELEHVTVLTRPIGFLLTTLGLQVSDVRNACAKLLIEMKSSLTDSSVSPQPEKFLRELTRWRNHGVRTLTFIELVLPLMEGIALYTEGTLKVTSLIDGPPCFDLAVALEYQHMLLVIGDQPSPFTEADRADAYSGLWDKMIGRLALARSQEAAYDAAHRLFFGPGRQAPGQETAPYFLGYLYVTRLLQSWRSTTAGEVSEPDLLLAANRFVGEVFALHASLVVGRTKNTRQLDDILSDLFAFLQMAPAFTKSDIDLLCHRDGPLSWQDGQLAPIDIGTTDASAYISRLIVALVFDDDDVPAQRATLEWLTAVDPAKNLQLTSALFARIREYDSREQTLLLELPELGQETVFEASPEAMAKFLAMRARQQLGPPSPGEGWPAAPAPAQLQTWLETWPDGIDKSAAHFDSYLNVVKIRRVLIIPDPDRPAEPPVALLDRSTPEDRSRPLQIRDSLLRSLDRNVQTAIGDGWRDLRRCADLASPFLVDEADEIFGRFWESYPDPTADITAWCHRAYAAYLFPGWPEDKLDTIASEKMGVLFQELESGGKEGWLAAEALWQFLKKAVWRPAGTATGSSPPAAGALDMIRSASLRVLGVPLVRAGPDGCEFDLAPPAETIGS